jgi:hypothetical protein
MYSKDWVLLREQGKPQYESADDVLSHISAPICYNPRQVAIFSKGHV